MKFRFYILPSGNIYINRTYSLMQYKILIWFICDSCESCWTSPYKALTKGRYKRYRRKILSSYWYMLDPFDDSRNTVCCETRPPFLVASSDAFHPVFSYSTPFCIRRLPNETGWKMLRTLNRVWLRSLLISWLIYYYYYY